MLNEAYTSLVTCSSFILHHTFLIKGLHGSVLGIRLSKTYFPFIILERPVLLDKGLER